jgi:hypothetical protein
VGDKVKLTQVLVKTLLDEHLFNEDQYSYLKSAAKLKSLHIGLNLWQLIVESIQKWDAKLKAREQLVESLVTSNFIKVLVKNVSNPKA